MKKKMLERTDAPAQDTKQKDDKTTVVVAQVHEDGERKVLELAIYKENQLFARHFLEKDKRDFASLVCKRLYTKKKIYEQGEWSEMNFTTIVNDGDQQYYWYFGSDVKYSKMTGDVIKQYFNMNSDQPIYRVIDCEDDISRNRRENALVRKAHKIETMMDQVKPVIDTQQFGEWLGKQFEKGYIFADTHKTKRGYKCRCSVCEKNWYEAKKPKHNAKMDCKNCKEELKIKTRVSSVLEQKNVIIIQQYKENVVLMRHFRFFKEDETDQFAKTNAKKAHNRIYGEERIRLFKNYREERTDIFYGQDRNKLENQTWWDIKHGVMFDKKTVVYPYEYQETDLPVEIKRCINAVVERGLEMDCNRLIRVAQEHEFLEYLIKAKYDNIVNSLVEWYSWRVDTPKWIDKKADTPHELLKLDKQRANRLRDMNGKVCTLLALQYEKETGKKISQENLMFINKYDVEIEDLQIQRTGMTANKAVNYFRRQMEMGNSYEHVRQTYEDYLDMAAERGMNLQDDIVRANARMFEFHQRYLEEKNREEDEKRAKELKKKFKNIKKNYSMNKAIYDFETEEYIFMVAGSVEEIIREGQEQHHCVGSSDTYFERMNNGVSFIVFMRRKSEPQVPYYTIEIKNTNVLQAYAAYDRKPDYEIVKKELNKWTKEIGKRIRRETKEHGRVAS